MSDIVLADEKTKLFTALGGYASALSNLSDEQVPAAFEMTQKMEALAEEVRERLRKRILDYVSEKGEVQTEKGTRGVNLGGFDLRAIPTKTGTDPKKLEALLRHKKLDPTVAMDATIAYKVNADKVLKAVERGELTQADVASCAYAPAFRVEVKPERSSE